MSTPICTDGKGRMFCGPLRAWVVRWPAGSCVVYADTPGSAAAAFRHECGYWGELTVEKAKGVKHDEQG